MGSQMNHNAAYIYSVDGLTVWERLRVIRGFIVDIETSIKRSELDNKKSWRKINEEKDQDEKEYLLELWEIDSFTRNDVIKKAKDELKFLTGFEKSLAIEAEKTRVEGLTDDEMYEHNYYNELVAQLVRKAHADVISCGHLSSNTLMEVLRCQPAVEILTEQNILNGQSVLSLTNTNVKGIAYANLSHNQ